MKQDKTVVDGLAMADGRITAVELADGKTAKLTMEIILRPKYRSVKGGAMLGHVGGQLPCKVKGITGGTISCNIMGTIDPKVIQLADKELAKNSRKLGRPIVRNSDGQLVISDNAADSPYNPYIGE